MRHIPTHLTIAFLLIFSYSTSYSQNSTTIYLGSGYSNQSFFNFQTNYEVKNETNNNWDLAFSTGSMSSTIRTNDGYGVELYTYSMGDTSDWNNINSSSITMVNSNLYNSDSNWTTGSFSSHQSSGFDLGWGMYSMITHHVTGDSIHLIRTVNGNWKKLWMEKLASGTYIFRHANLDGSNLVTQTISKSNYNTKNFVYYSIDNNAIIDREPNEFDWDITFTKYIAHDMFMPYSVTGVLANNGIEVAQANNISNPYNYSNYTNHTFESIINVIGYDWKTYDFSSGGYLISNDICYFIKDRNDDIFRLVLEEFEGSSTGKVVFNSSNISSTSLFNKNKITEINIYPNPVNNILNVITDFTNEKIKISIFDLTGKMTYENIFMSNGFQNHQIDVSQLQSGSYFVIFDLNDSTVTKKIIIN